MFRNQSMLGFVFCWVMFFTGFEGPKGFITMKTNIVGGEFCEKTSIKQANERWFVMKVCKFISREVGCTNILKTTFCMVPYSSMIYPRCSMYGIFTWIYHTFKPNVGKYTIRGAWAVAGNVQDSSMVISSLFNSRRERGLRGWEGIENDIIVGSYVFRAKPQVWFKHISVHQQTLLMSRCVYPFLGTNISPTSHHFWVDYFPFPQGGRCDGIANCNPIFSCAKVIQKVLTCSGVIQLYGGLITSHEIRIPIVINQDFMVHVMSQFWTLLNCPFAELFRIVEFYIDNISRQKKELYESTFPFHGACHEKSETCVSAAEEGMVPETWHFRDMVFQLPSESLGGGWRR